MNTPAKILIYEEQCSYGESVELLSKKFELIRIPLRIES
jgi:hypothetical protein